MALGANPVLALNLTAEPHTGDDAAGDLLMASSTSLRILGIAGSLRKHSFNRSLLAAAVERAPPGMTITIYPDLAAIPLFNQDVEAQGSPQSVQELRSAVADADGLLISTPEYNHSIPGVLKNVIDWLSRGEERVLDELPAGIMGATQGAWGTRLSQAALRQTLVACNVITMPSPQVYVRSSEEVFDSLGRMTDERTGTLLTRYLQALALWTAGARGMR
jgi:chromate reductase